jgi:hypothetical protein
MFQIVTLIAVVLLLIASAVIYAFGVRSFARARRDAGELLYRERSPWRRFSLARRALLVVGCLYVVLWCVLLTPTQAMQGNWLNALNGPMSLLIVGPWVYDARTGFPYSGLEFRANAMFIGCRAISWEKVGEYCWLEPGAALRLKLEHIGYQQWKVNPADRATIDTILQAHQIPVRPPSWDASSGV